MKLFAYACAIALVSAGMSSCKKDEPRGQEHLNGEDVVKTEFSIALPSQLARKKMPGTTVQAFPEQFQGIADGIVLIPFAEAAPIGSSFSRLGSGYITLAEGVSKADISGKTSNAKVYEDVTIPLSTASFLFYGKSAATGSKFQTGSLRNNLGDEPATPAGISFQLDPICPITRSLFVAADSAGGMLLKYLSNIAQAKPAGDGKKAWYETTDPALSAMFTTFSSMHGLSSFEVARVLSDLNKTLNPMSGELVDAIKTAINDADYATIDGSNNVVLKDDATNSASETIDLTNFPGQYNLPEGSIDMAWNDGEHKFEQGLYSGMAAPETFVYPAQLWYYANSSIATSNESQKTAYASLSNSWATILGLHDDAAAVNTRTRAVAIVNPIQYAVARLDVRIKVASTSLADNSDLAEGDATPVTVNASGFPVTAVLVGGQKDVDFAFQPAGGTEYTIYDKLMTKTMNAYTSLSDTNRVLVLETATATDVRIAIEMENNTGVDFYGVNNQLIPAGGKFYVCATLDNTAATTTGTKVFKQDYTTTANLNLKTLRAAYNTIPDLRTPQLELGFSVDLDWQAGTTYDIDIE